jgi:hypothetical protein
VALTDWDALIVTAHAPVPVHAPLQPLNVLPDAACALNVTAVPLLKLEEQVLPQLMPLGLLLIVPLPVPAVVVVSTKVLVLLEEKLADTDWAALIVTVQLLALPVHAPPQPPKLCPLAACSVRVTTVPAVYEDEQALAQEMPPGVLLIVPPEPGLATVSV